MFVQEKKKQPFFLDGRTKALDVMHKTWYRFLKLSSLTDIGILNCNLQVKLIFGHLRDEYQI